MAYTPEQERKLVILGSNSTEPVGFGGAAGIRISPGEDLYWQAIGTQIPFLFSD